MISASTNAINSVEYSRDSSNVGSIRIKAENNAPSNSILTEPKSEHPNLQSLRCNNGQLRKHTNPHDFDYGGSSYYTMHCATTSVVSCGTTSIPTEITRLEKTVKTGQTKSKFRDTSNQTDKVTVTKTEEGVRQTGSQNVNVLNGSTNHATSPSPVSFPIKIQSGNLPNQEFDKQRVPIRRAEHVFNHYGSEDLNDLDVETNHAINVPLEMGNNEPQNKSAGDAVSFSDNISDIICLDEFTSELCDTNQGSHIEVITSETNDHLNECPFSVAPVVSILTEFQKDTVETAAKKYDAIPPQKGLPREATITRRVDLHGSEKVDALYEDKIQVVSSSPLTMTPSEMQIDAPEESKSSSDVYNQAETNQVLNNSAICLEANIIQRENANIIQRENANKSQDKNNVSVTNGDLDESINKEHTIDQEFEYQTQESPVDLSSDPDILCIEDYINDVKCFNENKVNPIKLKSFDTNDEFNGSGMTIIEGYSINPDSLKKTQEVSEMPNHIVAKVLKDITAETTESQDKDLEKNAVKPLKVSEHNYNNSDSKGRDENASRKRSRSFSTVESNVQTVTKRSKMGQFLGNKCEINTRHTDRIPISANNKEVNTGNKAEISIITVLPIEVSNKPDNNSENIIAEKCKGQIISQNVPVSNLSPVENSDTSDTLNRSTNNDASSIPSSISSEMQTDALKEAVVQFPRDTRNQAGTNHLLNSSDTCSVEELTEKTITNKSQDLCQSEDTGANGQLKDFEKSGNKEPFIGSQLQYQDVPNFIPTENVKTSCNNDQFANEKANSVNQNGTEPQNVSVTQLCTGKAMSCAEVDSNATLSQTVILDATKTSMRVYSIQLHKMQCMQRQRITKRQKQVTATISTLAHEELMKIPVLYTKGETKSVASKHGKSDSSVNLDNKMKGTKHDKKIEDTLSDSSKHKTIEQELLRKDLSNDHHAEVKHPSINTGHQVIVSNQGLDSDTLPLAKHNKCVESLKQLAQAEVMRARRTNAKMYDSNVQNTPREKDTLSDLSKYKTIEQELLRKDLPNDHHAEVKHPSINTGHQVIVSNQGLDSNTLPLAKHNKCVESLKQLAQAQIMRARRTNAKMYDSNVQNTPREKDTLSDSSKYKTIEQELLRKDLPNDHHAEVKHPSINTGHQVIVMRARRTNGKMYDSNVQNTPREKEVNNQKSNGGLSNNDSKAHLVSKLVILETRGQIENNVACDNNWKGTSKSLELRASGENPALVSQTSSTFNSKRLNCVNVVASLTQLAQVQVTKNKHVIVQTSKVVYTIKPDAANGNPKDKNISSSITQKLNDPNETINMKTSEFLVGPDRFKSVTQANTKEITGSIMRHPNKSHAKTDNLENEKEVKGATIKPFETLQKDMNDTFNNSNESGAVLDCEK